ncbi:MAG: hypothetical protein IKS21_00740 [Oscillospiraceae bacterium]|nr:hypothetical protein [Oscillospiraceae bacterium]
MQFAGGKSNAPYCCNAVADERCSSLRARTTENCQLSTVNCQSQPQPGLSP